MPLLHIHVELKRGLVGKTEISVPKEEDAHAYGGTKGNCEGMSEGRRLLCIEYIKKTIGRVPTIKCNTIISQIKASFMQYCVLLEESLDAEEGHRCEGENVQAGEEEIEEKKKEEAVVVVPHAVEHPLQVQYTIQYILIINRGYCIYCTVYCIIE